MGGRDEKPDFEDLEAHVGELEDLADRLGDVPDEELVEVLSRAVELLREVNVGIEAGMRSLEAESREVDHLLDRVDFGAFDAAIEDQEQQERTSDGYGP